MSRTYKHTMPKLYWEYVLGHKDKKKLPKYIINKEKDSHWFEFYTNRHRESPKWWDNLHHTRPKRRQNRSVCNDIRQGRIDPLDALFPTGNNKPHQYWT